GVNSGRRRGVTGVDGADCGMGMRAAHEARMQQAGQRDIVDKAGASLQQGLVLDPMNALSDQARAFLCFAFPLLYLIVYNLTGVTSRRPRGVGKVRQMARAKAASRAPRNIQAGICALAEYDGAPLSRRRPGRPSRWRERCEGARYRIGHD